ncbi:SGNH/GDSL hydrolase family protein [Microbacterium sp. HMH0099]|uniref:SGNH/GDSL hydrolase family protein n=1 Tax=Microbacterium sp. HMH0099 TaxID=3414026 RepID=UPI003BF6A970
MTVRRPLVALSAVLVAALAACAPQPAPAPAPTLTFSAASPAPNASATTPPRLRVVTVGDSLMSGFGLDLGQAWPVLLAGRAHLSLTNLACSGMGFVVSGDCGTPYVGFAPALAALQPDLVIIESSSNDFGEDPDDIAAETLTTVEEMQEAAPNARLVGLSTIWNDEDDMPEEVHLTSDALADALDLVDGTYIDVGQPLAGHPDWMQPDDVHPTARGQKAIEQTVMSRLQAAGVLP